MPYAKPALGKKVRMETPGAAMSDRALMGDPAPCGRMVHKMRRINTRQIAPALSADGGLGGAGAGQEEVEASNMTRDLLLKYFKPFIMEGSDDAHLAVLGVFAVAAWLGIVGSMYRLRLTTMVITIRQPLRPVLTEIGLRVAICRW